MTQIIGSMGSSTGTGEAVRCTRCGAAFVCNPGGDCWCAELASLPMPKEGESCLCPACLDAELQRKRPSD